jgi:DNA-binding XRE family transcriptional regulator
MAKAGDVRKRLAEMQVEMITLKKLSRVKRSPRTGTLGGVIQSSRETAGLGLREAADRVGIGASTMHNVEEDAIKANPTLATLLKMAKAVKRPLSSIFKDWEEAVQKSKPSKHGRSRTTRRAAKSE